MIEPLRYDIRNPDIAKDLINQGFSVYNTSPGIWTLESPPDLSATKARKLISICIKLYQTAQNFNRIKRKYESLVEEINRINQSR